jgi:hypothetical protein
LKKNQELISKDQEIIKIAQEIDKKNQEISDLNDLITLLRREKFAPRSEASDIKIFNEVKIYLLQKLMKIATTQKR